MKSKLKSNTHRCEWARERHWVVRELNKLWIDVNVIFDSIAVSSRRNFVWHQSVLAALLLIKMHFQKIAVIEWGMMCDVSDYSPRCAVQLLNFETRPVEKVLLVAVQLRALYQFYLDIGRRL